MDFLQEHKPYIITGVVILAALLVFKRVFAPKVQPATTTTDQSQVSQTPDPVVQYIPESTSYITENYTDNSQTTNPPIVPPVTTPPPTTTPPPSTNPPTSSNPPWWDQPGNNQPPPVTAPPTTTPPPVVTPPPPSGSPPVSSDPTAPYPHPASYTQLLAGPYSGMNVYADPASGDMWFGNTQHTVSHGFRAWYRTNDQGLTIMGAPITQEFTDQNNIVKQMFQKGYLLWKPGQNVGPYDVDVHPNSGGSSPNVMQDIRMPVYPLHPMNHTIHTVKPGETLNDIANIYNVLWSNLYDRNKHTIDSVAQSHGMPIPGGPANNLYVGTKLVIPA